VIKMLAGCGFHTVESSGASVDLTLARVALIEDA
jgi:outer membrane lipopolysaccharide assembly protein LptE/RlpB